MNVIKQLITIVLVLVVSYLSRVQSPAVMALLESTQLSAADAREVARTTQAKAVPAEVLQAIHEAAQAGKYSLLIAPVSDETALGLQVLGYKIVFCGKPGAPSQELDQISW